MQRLGQKGRLIDSAVIDKLTNAMQANQPIVANEVALADFPLAKPRVKATAEQLTEPLDAAGESRVIEMAWEDRTPFDAIERQFGLNESAVITLMRRSMKPSSFNMWRKRVTARATKHSGMRSGEVTRHRASHTRQC